MRTRSYTRRSNPRLHMFLSYRLRANSDGSNVHSEPSSAYRGAVMAAAVPDIHEIVSQYSFRGIQERPWVMGARAIRHIAGQLGLTPVAESRASGYPGS